MRCQSCLGFRFHSAFGTAPSQNVRCNLNCSETSQYVEREANRASCQSLTTALISSSSVCAPTVVFEMKSQAYQRFRIYMYVRRCTWKLRGRSYIQYWNKSIVSRRVARFWATSTVNDDVFGDTKTKNCRVILRSSFVYKVGLKNHYTAPNQIIKSIFVTQANKYSLSSR